MSQGLKVKPYDGPLGMAAGDVEGFLPRAVEPWNFGHLFNLVLCQSVMSFPTVFLLFLCKYGDIL